MVDGVLGNEVGQTNRMAQQINLDAVAEIKVLLNTYRAEYGRTGGAQIQIVSKGGGAEYRGNAYYYGRHEKLQRQQLLQQPRRPPRAALPLQHLRLQPRRPDSRAQQGRRQEAVLLLFDGGAAHRAAGPAAQLPDADRGGAPRRLLADARPERRHLIADPRPADRASRSPATSSPPTRINPNGQALLNMLPLPERRRGNLGIQLPVAGDRRQPEDQQHRPPRLEAVGERQPLLHVQGLVLGPARQRGHGGPGEVGLVQHALPEHRPRRQRQLHEDLRSNLVNEAAAASASRREQFHPVDEATGRALRRADNGYTLGQLYPDVNPWTRCPR